VVKKEYERLLPVTTARWQTFIAPCASRQTAPPRVVRIGLRSHHPPAHVTKEEFMNVTVWLGIGCLLGWAAARLTRSPDSIVMNVFVGMLGAFAGGWVLAPMVGDGTISSGDFSAGGIALSLLGAVLLLAIVNVLRGRRAH
jgi:uncharacterized membrane protein YeaQ/YmgE (transglycosylase-associated protein family)